MVMELIPAHPHNILAFSLPPSIEGWILQHHFMIFRRMRSNSGSSCVIVVFHVIQADAR